MQTDLKAGLHTGIDVVGGGSGSIGEIVRTAERHGMKCDTCEKVLGLVTAAVKTGNTDIKLSGQELWEKVGKPTASRKYFWKWLGQAGAVILCVVAIIVGYLLL